MRTTKVNAIICQVSFVIKGCKQFFKFLDGQCVIKYTMLPILPNRRFLLVIRTDRFWLSTSSTLSQIELAAITEKNGKKILKQRKIFRKQKQDQGVV